MSPFSDFSESPRRDVLGSSTLGMVMIEEEKEITRLVQERMRVDWVTEDIGSRVDGYAEALREFHRLNGVIYRTMKQAVRKFHVFMKAAIPELDPLGLRVSVSTPQVISDDPEEWVSPEFIIKATVQDTRGLLQVQGPLSFRVDVRTPVAITETVNSVSFMANTNQDNYLTPGNMLIQALHPRTHLEASDFLTWRHKRLEHQ